MVIPASSLVLPLKFVHRDEALTISCQTNDPTAEVTLSTRPSRGEPYVNVLTKFKDGITKTKQTFYIPMLSTLHGGYYQCAARTTTDPEIELELGQLRVSPSMLFFYLFKSKL